MVAMGPYQQSAGFPRRPSAGFWPGSSLDIDGSSVMSLPPRQRYLPRSCRAGSCANMMVAEISTGLRDEEGSMKLPQTGGRQREKVRYEITEEPQSVYTCHCLIANA
jgi:hypothetical protein